MCKAMCGLNRKGRPKKQPCTPEEGAMLARGYALGFITYGEFHAFCPDEAEDRAGMKKLRSELKIIFEDT